MPTAVFSSPSTCVNSCSALSLDPPSLCHLPPAGHVTTCAAHQTTCEHIFKLCGVYGDVQKVKVNPILPTAAACLSVQQQPVNIISLSLGTGAVQQARQCTG